ncbi:hypothetical protein BFW38_02080 [Terasakiispira papahanaumokuakeensis]|uniref:SIMPL domain-containing protein n=1 Tax=Terasakiispira papahanaumokuakeensis TaxID=197479 RepID=A0A1E2V6H5_9GAMM|nr:SIMPL domain-containing protein [Terasakiispira papahanaumokuakeensis]ODC02513.1 hypothetical protein BFW38_02080 [Terasakiispira papahanaumokuakeensis]
MTTDQNKPSHAWLGAAIVSLGIVIAAALIAQALNAYQDSRRQVSVKGLAERQVDADLALWPLNFLVTGNQLDQVQQEVERQADLLRQFLLDAGFKAEDLQMSMPSIEDMQINNYGNQQPKARYKSSPTLLVRTHDVARVKATMQKVGQVIRQGVALTQSYEYRPQFLFTRLNDIKPEMIAQATANAREAAARFARDSGAQVGGIRHAEQGYFSINDLDSYTPEVKKIRVVTRIDYQLED